MFTATSNTTIAMLFLSVRDDDDDVRMKYSDHKRTIKTVHENDVDHMQCYICLLLSMIACVGENFNVFKCRCAKNSLHTIKIYVKHLHMQAPPKVN